MPLRTLPALLVVLSLAACAPAGRDASPAPTATTKAATGAPVAPTATVAARATTAIHPLHGHWRLVAADDPHDAALMAFSIQSNAGDATGSGDYVLFQPFCDVVADLPVAGDADCELIGLGAPFDRVEIDQARILLVFKPTADDVPHRLELRAEGDALVGDYVSEANRIRRAVIARHPPADAP